ncbi:hypothetical protein F1B92_03935 [Campylobacter sp. FMV-PI01]|uniref:Phage tail assembly protein n=1 Tax=Campylobacter portucalensis TaxID=2608384 RepID=A0A6L5WJB6_9BACT|nr:hypothetical protein [Campylobacter portucalensis]MSN96347.1 hypothetical protein [Campylobacter portucalensis]
MLKKIEPEFKEFIFSDGQSVVLKAPTLAQVQKAENSKNDVEKLVSLLIDMSDGEMDKEFINSLPVAEIGKISEVVAQLTGFSEKN